jgi:hypothetical protein
MSFALLEGLDAHAIAANIRFKRNYKWEYMKLNAILKRQK